MTFIYVSGSGTDASERGRAMWARVKVRTENALLALPFKAAYCSARRSSSRFTLIPLDDCEQARVRLVNTCKEAEPKAAGERCDATRVARSPLPRPRAHTLLPAPWLPSTSRRAHGGLVHHLRS